MSRESAKEFQKKYGKEKLDSEKLQSIIESQGYTFIEFNGIADSKEVRTLVQLLNVQKNVESSRCFVYQDHHYRLLFIHEDLNEEERRIVLAHEEGHIWNKHLISGSSIYEDVVQEFEANEFAHYILKDNTRDRRKRRIFLGIICTGFLLAAGVFARRQYDEVTYTENLYVTEAGSKYHRRQCVYIRDRKDVRRMTSEEYEAGQYQPCDVCFPDDQIQNAD